MAQKAVKIGITTLILGFAFAGLLWTTLSEGTENYKHVEEVVAAPESWHGKRLQLHGYVVTDSVLKKRDSLDYRFKIESQGAVVDATYTGIVPDTFKSGSEVVLRGRLTPTGFEVEPNGIMAKCPSKYEAKPLGPRVGG